MKYKIFTKTTKFRDALRVDIQNAKKSIYLEMYIFVNDIQESYNFVELLSKKSHEGIEVILVLDAYGSRALKNESINKIKKAGIEIRFFSDWLRRNHRKIIIIDEEIAYFGWANIVKHSLHWLDLQIRIKGKKIIKPILKTFAYTYKMCGGENKHILQYHKKWFFKKIKSFLIENLPGHEHYRLIDYYKEKIITAKKSIKIATPYFIPPRWLIALLDDAIRRGVKIQIIIPYDTDIKTLNKVNYYYINELMDLGIEFYAMSKMNHAKIMIIDGKEGVIGSQNIDKLSFGPNFEMGAFFTQRNLVQNLIQIFNRRKRTSRLYKKNTIRLSIKDKIICRFLRLIFYFI